MEFELKSQFDINKTTNIEKIFINIDGWYDPLEIHYGIYNFDNIQYLLWKIANTDHTFKIQAKIIYQHHGVKIEDHFKMTLLQFRKDYLNWMEEGFPEQWQQRYYRIFNSYIEI